MIVSYRHCRREFWVNSSVSLDVRLILRHICTELHSGLLKTLVSLVPPPLYVLKWWYIVCVICTDYAELTALASFVH